MKISGIMPLRNVVRLGYPFELAIRSLRPACDQIVVNVCLDSEDGTMRRIEAMQDAGEVDIIVRSRWNMSNHDGRNDEIAKQTAIALGISTGDWVVSLQADEVLHPAEAERLKGAMEVADATGITCLELQRLYFYGSLGQYRDNWTFWLRRAFRRGCWRPDPESGAMQFVSFGEQRLLALDGVRIYHYSRVGDPQLVADRVRNLDGFYHPPERIAEAAPPYDYSRLRRLDTYVVGTEPEDDPDARLVSFPLEGHPPGVRELFHE